MNHVNSDKEYLSLFSSNITNRPTFEFQLESHISRSKPDRGSSFLRCVFHGYQLSDLFNSKDYIVPIAVLAIGDVPRVRRMQFESV